MNMIHSFTVTSAWSWLHELWKHKNRTFVPRYIAKLALMECGYCELWILKPVLASTRQNTSVENWIRTEDKSVLKHLIASPGCHQYRLILCCPDLLPSDYCSFASSRKSSVSSPCWLSIILTSLSSLCVIVKHRLLKIDHHSILQ